MWNVDVIERETEGSEKAARGTEASGDSPQSDTCPANEHRCDPGHVPELFLNPQGRLLQTGQSEAVHAKCQALLWLFSFSSVSEFHACPGTGLGLARNTCSGSAQHVCCERPLFEWGRVYFRPPKVSSQHRSLTLPFVFPFCRGAGISWRISGTGN